MPESYDDNATKKGNFLTQKKGPLPVWGYGVIGLAVVIYFVMRARSQSSGTATNAAIGPGTVGAGSVLDPSTAQSLGDQLTALQNTLASQQAATIPPPASVPFWQFGTPKAGQPFQWQLTQAGQNEYLQKTGTPWTYGALPSSVPIPSQIQGANTWQYSQTSVPPA